MSDTKRNDRIREWGEHFRKESSERIAHVVGEQSKDVEAAEDKLKKQADLFLTLIQVREALERTPALPSPPDLGAVLEETARLLELRMRDYRERSDMLRDLAAAQLNAEANREPVDR